jgi:hypothetical protein
MSFTEKQHVQTANNPRSPQSYTNAQRLLASQPTLFFVTIYLEYRNMQRAMTLLRGPKMYEYLYNSYIYKNFRRLSTRSLGAIGNGTQRHTETEGREGLYKKYIFQTIVYEVYWSAVLNPHTFCLGGEKYEARNSEKASCTYRF